MNRYTEQPQTGDLSCKGCIFNKQIIKKKLVKDPCNAKRKILVDDPTGQYGCYSPKGEPFDSCLERKVIFTQG